MRLPLRSLHWLGLGAGLALGLSDHLALRALGVAMRLGETDVTAAVMAAFAATFAGLGFVIGRLAQARAASRADAETIHAQLVALRDAQRRLVHAETLASIGRLAAGVAHEVRNPLGVIRSASGLLAEGLDPADDRAAAATFIRDEVDRLDGFVGRLLDFARPVAVAPRVGAVGPAVGAGVQLARAAAPALQVQVATAGEAHAAADPELVPGVILGLVLNAAQAGATRVEVRVETAEGGARIEVADDGPGLPEAQREAAFEPFFTTKASGTGLGLAMARRVVDAHGGSLTYADGAGAGPNGAGACFRIHLPEAA